MTKEEIFKLIVRGMSQSEIHVAIDKIYDEIQTAYNTIKTPTAFLVDAKSITVDTSNAKTSEDLFQFMIANFPSGYFRSLATKILDYTEKGKIIPQQVLDDFEKFYSLYPKKVNRHAALLKYKTLKPSTTLFNKITEGLLKQKYLWEKAGTDKQYMPAPNVWLNNRRWEDEELNNVTLDEIHSSMERIFK